MLVCMILRCSCVADMSFYLTVKHYELHYPVYRCLFLFVSEACYGQHVPSPSSAELCHYQSLYKKILGDLS